MYDKKLIKVDVGLLATIIFMICWCVSFVYLYYLYWNSDF
jgi:hypothetical protein